MKQTVWIALICALGLAGASPKEIEGRWSNGRLSMIQYRDVITGVGRPPAGNYFSYEFRADGTYRFLGLMQTTMYQCTTTAFGEESGTYEMTAEGVVALHPQKNPFKMTNNCAPSANREVPGKLTERSYRVEIVGDRLELKGADQSVQTFQRDRSLPSR